MIATPTEVHGYAQSRVLVQSLIAPGGSPPNSVDNRQIEIFTSI
jgi:hypothetical protein